MAIEPIIKDYSDKTEYKVGSTSISGYKIVHIISATTDCIIFENETGGISWEYTNKDGEIADLAVVRFNEIYEHIPNDISRKLYFDLRVSLCSVFLAAISSTSLDECNKKFDLIGSRIKKIKTNYQVKSIFILFSIIFTLLLSFIGLCLYKYSNYEFSMVFICISCGCIGSLFSVLQRNDKLIMDAALPNKYILLQASFTAILGCISGGLIYLLAKSELALSFASDNMHSLALLSIVGGFSERMIPELFKKIDKS